MTAWDRFFAELSLSAGKLFVQWLTESLGSPASRRPPHTQPRLSQEEEWDQFLQRLRARPAGRTPAQKPETAPDARALATQKIAKLVTLAKGTSNPNEADTAWQTAEELAKKHGIPFTFEGRPQPVSPPAPPPPPPIKTPPTHTPAPVTSTAPQPEPVPPAQQPTQQEAAPSSATPKPKRASRAKKAATPEPKAEPKRKTAAEKAPAEKAAAKPKAASKKTAAKRTPKQSS